MIRHRDSQRSRVYAAENEIGIHEAGDRFFDVNQIAWWLDDVIKIEVARGDYAKMLVRPVGLRVAKQGALRSYANARRILLSPRQMRHSVILHELAHVIVNRGWPKDAGHAWRWCSIYLRLLEHHQPGMALVADPPGAPGHIQRGPVPWHVALRAAFDRHRVTYTIPVGCLAAGPTC